MIRKVAAIAALLMIASLSVTGCTFPISTGPSPTPTSAPTVTTVTPPADYSSYFNKNWESSGMIVERLFTKSINARGNDVYMGIMRNTSLSQGNSVTVVEEFTKSQAEAKQVYDQYVVQKLSEGFSLRTDWVASMKSDPTRAQYDGMWAGTLGVREFFVFYHYNPEVNSWDVTTQAGSATS